MFMHSREDKHAQMQMVIIAKQVTENGLNYSYFYDFYFAAQINVFCCLVML